MEPTRTVLVVDDDPANRLLLGDLLEVSGFDVSSAYNGAEALSRIETSCPDIILLDILLPDQNGIEICATLRQRIPTTTTIYLMSGLDDTGTRRRGDAESSGALPALDCGDHIDAAFRAQPGRSGSSYLYVDAPHPADCR